MQSSWRWLLGLCLCGIATLRHAATVETPCTAVTSPGPTELYILSSSRKYISRDINWALGCYSSITVDYATASQYASALAGFFQEYYASMDMAKDPLATPQSNPFDWKVYSSAKVDIVKQLTDLAQSWTPNTPVPLSRLAFPINDIFNSLRDAQVGAYGFKSSDAAYGNLLARHSLSLLDVPRARASPVDGSVYLTIRSDLRRNNKAVLSDSYSGKVISRVGGLSPMAWLRSLLLKPTLQYPSYKSEGARINALMALFLGAPYRSLPVYNAGTLDHLAAPIAVQYRDGSNTTWQWAVTVQADFGLNATLSDLSKQVGQLGVPYLAMEQARAIVAASQSQQPLPASLLQQHYELRQQLQDERSGAATTATAEPELQQGPGLGPTRSIVSSGTKVGLYGLMNHTDGSLVAFWKLVTSGIGPDVYARYWSDLVQLAENATAAGTPVSRLVYDVSANGGGSVATFHLAVAAIYPELLSQGNTYPWLTQYQKRVGPLAKYMVDNKLLYEDQGSGGFYTRVQRYVSNASWVDARAEELSSNKTALLGLAALHDAMFEAINLTMNTAASSLTSCSGDLKSCTFVWDGFYSKFKQAFGGQNLSEHFKSSPLEAGALLYLLNQSALLSFFSPYMDPYIPNNEGTVAELVAYVNASFFGRAPDLLFINTSYVNRGGVVGEYTGRYSMQSLVGYVQNGQLFGSIMFPKSHPFKQVLAVTDGRCGSACSMFTSACWLYSKTNPGVSFKFVTYGGTGSTRDISPNAFPGGNVVGNDPLSGTWAYSGLLYLLAQWTGDASLISQAADLASQLPHFPSLNLNATPKFTASLGYLPSLGNATLPLDFYLLPNDHYLPRWFVNTGVDGADLPALYSLASELFKS